MSCWVDCGLGWYGESSERSDTVLRVGGEEGSRRQSGISWSVMFVVGVRLCQSQFTRGSDCIFCSSWVVLKAEGTFGVVYY